MRDIALIFIVAIVIAAVLRAFIIRSFFIPSGSMENTLLINDRVVVTPLQPDLVALGRGDIVVFEDPGGWLPPSDAPEPNVIDWALTIIGIGNADADNHLIKRIIGLPGDHVVCCNDNDQLVVNDVPVEESYLNPSTQGISSDTAFDVTVPDDAMWVLGDNRKSSADSRSHVEEPGEGFVPLANVVGRAIAVTWPIDRWKLLNPPSQLADIPDRR